MTTFSRKIFAACLTAGLVAASLATRAQPPAVDGVQGAQTVKRIEDLSRARKYEELALLCQEALAGDALSPGQQATAYHHLSVAAQQLEQPDAAYAASLRGAHLAATSFPASWDVIFRRVCTFADDSSRLEEIAAVLKTAIDTLADPDDARTMKLVAYLADCHLRAGRPDDALQAVKPSIDAGRGGGGVMEAYVRAVADLGDHREALLRILALRREGATPAAMRSFRGIEDASLAAFARDTPPEEARGFLREYMLGGIADPAAVDACLSLIVDTLIAEDRLPEAVWEARVLVETCQPATVENAVRKLVAGIKSIDGHLGRANAYIEYQKFLKPGPDGILGTDDDLQNPIADIGIYPDADRDALFQAAVDDAPDCWEGQLLKAKLYKYWGRPQTALEHTRLAFGRAPFDDRAIQTITDETVVILYQLSGNPAIGQAFVDYVRFGPAGPDGKLGTEDDLTNPAMAYWP